MKKILLLFVCLLATGIGAVWAQTGQVSGIVTENGQPLIGATVAVKGSNTAVVTDANGRYAIPVRENDVLVFSFVGLKTQEVPVGSRSVINVTMETDVAVLEEVVLVAYGTALKRNQAAAVSSVNTASLKDIPITTFENALQGAATGIQVGSPNGQPGAQVQIRIRGTGSYNASNEPLYVIDGIPANSGDYALVGYGSSMSIMSTLNPSDIENITILKDAAATSLYGSRGANGVVLVTTKKGKEGGIRVNFKGSWGFNDFAVNNRPTLGGEDTRMLTLEGAYNQAIFNGRTETEARAFALAEANTITPVQPAYSDWLGALKRTAQNNNYEVSVSGGDEKTTFYSSVAYRKDLGMFYDSDLDGYTGKASLNHHSNKWTLAAGTTMSKITQHVTPGQSGGSVAFANPYYATQSYLLPNIPIYNPDGSYYEGPMFTGNYYNLVADQKKNSSTNAMFKSSNNISVAYEFIPGLSLKETLSYDYTSIAGTAIYRGDSKDGAAYGGATTKYDYVTGKFYSSLLLTYDKTFREDHTVNALLGWDVDDTRDNYVLAEGQGFASIKLNELAAAATPIGASSNHYDDRIVSYFGRLNYTYLNRYYLSGTFRSDGSTRLGANTRWGNFWSASASWRVKEESFLKDVDFVDNFKLRASYGVSGTLPSALYGALATYSYSGAYDDHPGATPARIPNPDLSWERNFVFDIGLEARFFDRVDVEFDFYDRQTEDMLLDVPLSLTTGFASTLLNVGGMNNRGVELTVGVDIFKGEGDRFNWNSTLMLSHNRNKVTKLYGDVTEIPNGTYRIKEGYSLYSFYGREWGGVDPATGDSMWYTNTMDENGNIIDHSLTKDPAQATRLILGKADPFLTGGWRNTLSYYGVSLDFLFSFSLGGRSWDNGFNTTADGLYPNNVISELQLDRWQKPGDIATFPRRMYGGGHGNYTSSRWMHPSDYLRLKSLTLGYTIPHKWTRQAHIQNARIFVAGNNLLTWSAYSDYDPELAIDGGTTYQIPVLKNITFGIEIGF
jgi:TonB-linked SusC/RagA family outer membrane protein